MRVIVHAGLHKSGTTSVQSAFASAFERPGDVWYPRVGKGGSPGHHALFWPLLSAFTEARDPDLVLASTLGRGGTPADLATLLQQAESHGVQHLVLSAEDLDRLTTADATRIDGALAGHQVEAVLTVTRPLHRWCSGWQELVKHGLGGYPDEAADAVARFSSTTSGRLADLIETLPGRHVTVRLVRTDPPEPSLASDLARTLTLPSPGVARQPANASLGRDIEILRRLNAAGVCLGLDATARAMLRDLRSAHPSGFEYAEPPGLAAHFEPPAALWEAAARERAYLAAPPEQVSVVDPHGILEDWESREGPPWLADVARFEAILDLPEPGPTDEGTWRRRQLAEAQVRIAKREQRRASTE